MKGKSFFNTIGVTIVALAMVACGSSGGDGTSPNMTLGITSLGSGTTTTKPSLASNFVGKAANFFSVNEAVANCADPADGLFVKITDAGVPADMIWITRAYAILEEIEFEDDDNSHDDVPDDNIQHAIDLLGNDGNVESEVPLVVPDGIVARSMKFKVQRLEDDTLNLLKGVGDQDMFLDDIGFNDGDGKRVRPSIFFKGDIMAGGTCHTFRFVADGRFRTTVPFESGASFDPASVKGILQFNIEDAFEQSGITVADLANELGFQSEDKQLPVSDYLDGRTKDPETGSTKARLWAVALKSSWEIFTKPLDTDNSLDGSDGTVTHISGSDPDRPDDNPSFDDV